MAEAAATPRVFEGGFSIRKRLVVFLVLVFLIGAYTSFLTADIYSLYLEASTQAAGLAYVSGLKYACVLLALLLTLLIGRDGHDRRDRTLLQAAFLLIAVADLLIGILDRFVAGIAVFFVVQLCLIARHSRGWVLDRREVVSFALILGGAGTLLACLWSILPGHLRLPAVLYVLVLATSVWMAVGTVWRTFFARTLDWFIVGGMVYFFFCDVNVGLSAALEGRQQSLTRYLVDPATGRTGLPVGSLDSPLLAQIAHWLVWYFYLPALTLLATSGYRLPFLRSILPLIPVLPEPGDRDE